MQTVGETPVHVYARQGNLRCARMLAAMPPAERAEALEETDVWGDSPLNLAAACPRGTPLVQALVDLGANIQHPGQFGLRPRLSAAATGSPQSVAVLAAHGAALDIAPLDEVSARRFLAAVFGLSGTTPWQGCSLELSGALAEGVYAPLAEAFADFLTTPIGQTLPASLGQAILGALQQAPLQVTRGAEALMAEVRSGLPIIVPSGWQGHATAHVVWGGRAMQCNRLTLGGRYAPLRLMDVGTPRALRQVLHTVLALRNAAAPLGVAGLKCLTVQHAAQRGDALRQALRTPLCKPQHTGNCTVASAKSAVLALLLLAAPDASAATVARSRALYKAFTTHLRVHTLAHYAQRPPPRDDALLQRCTERLADSGRLRQPQTG